MNGQSTVNHPTNNNEQLIGKFHVVSVDKLPINPVNSHDEITTAAAGQQQQPAAAASHPPPASSATDESACASRFQMIRVDRNFGRGRWKVNDYEPPEHISTSTNQPVNTTENEPVNISNASTLLTIPTTSTNTIPANILTGLLGDPNATSSATLAATAASAAAAAATAFQQQQQRLALNNPPTVVPTANVPPSTGLLHPYPGAPNQSYILQNHPQFGYYPFFPSPYSPYAAQWAALAAANHYLPMPPHQQQASQLLTGNLGDALRYMDAVPDVTNENPVISSNPFPNSATDHLQNAQMAASFLYAAHHPHSPYVSQPPQTTASPYATIASYHPGPPPPSIIPSSTQPLSLAQMFPNNMADIQQQQQQHQQHAPILTSPKHDTSSIKNPVQYSVAPKPPTTIATAPTNLTRPLTTATNGVNIDTLRTSTTNNPTQITDLLSSSPSIPNSQLPPSLLSPITVHTNNPDKEPTTSLNEIWSYATGGSPLNLTQAAAQTAAVSAVAAMGLLTNENSKNTEIANEILKELTTPTKQNNYSLSERRARLRYRRQRSTTDIDNKISAAMDLVKMHLLSAVREEVTELRQQIRTLNEKVNSAEHENAFLRQHVPSEIYAQYTPLIVGSSAANDSLNSTTTATTTAPIVPILSSQPLSTASLPSLSSSIAQHPSLSTNSQPPPPQPPPPSSINLPPT